MDESKIQAWLLCVELLNKAKGEFITQAIETLRGEVEKKNIDIKGQTISAPEDSNENEREEIVLNKIADDYESIREKYEPYVSGEIDAVAAKDPAAVERTEKLRKFMLSLEKISILMGFGRLCDEWMHDVAIEVSIDDPSEILSKTMRDRSERKEMAKFVIANKEISKNEVFTKEELELFRKALSAQ